MRSNFPPAVGVPVLCLGEHVVVFSVALHRRQALRPDWATRAVSCLKVVVRAGNVNSMRANFINQISNVKVYCSLRPMAERMASYARMRLAVVGVITLNKSPSTWLALRMPTSDQRQLLQLLNSCNEPAHWSTHAPQGSRSWPRSTRTLRADTAAHVGHMCPQC